MLRVQVYLKSGAVAAFEAARVEEGAGPHPKFRLEFVPPEGGGRRLVYLDRDDVSAVVVEDESAAGSGPRTAQAEVEVPAPIREEVEEVLTVVSAGGVCPPG